MLEPSEKSLASIYLSQAGLPQLADHEQAFALFAASELLDAGLSPRALMRGLDLDPAPLDHLRKYAPDQPRVPAGSGRESGRWTSGGGGAPQLVSAGGGGASQPASEGGGGAPAPRVQVAENRHGPTLSDVPPEPGRHTFVHHVKLHIAGATESDTTHAGIIPVAEYARVSSRPVISQERLNHILELHGPNSPYKEKGKFTAEYANERGIRGLIDDAWKQATPDDLMVGRTSDCVVIGAGVAVIVDGVAQPYIIGQSGENLRVPSIPTNTYVVILDSSNHVISCYPINPTDEINPREE